MVPRRVPLLLLFLSTFLAAIAACSRRSEPPAEIATSADQLFGHEVIPRLELTISDESLAKLAKKPRKYVDATLRHGTVELAKISVRMKGHRAMRGLDGKPSFKLAFDRKDPAQRFLGLRGLTLNGLVEDPTLLRETLAYRLFRAAGAPAPRTGFAEVVVNGQPYGLYLALESIDEELLAREVGDGSGPLFEGEYGCDLRPEDVPGFDQDGGEESRVSFLALAEAAEREPARLFGGDAPLLDVPRVLAFLAVEAAIGDFDGYRHSHNYRIYEVPASKRWVLLPWGLDRSLKRQMKIDDFSSVIPKVCFADAACKRAYVAEIQRVAGVFEGLALEAAVPTLAARIDPIAARDPRAAHKPAETQAARAKLIEFLRVRAAGLRAQTTCLADGKEVDADGDGAGCLDCDDGNATVHPGGPEVCGNRLDDDCSGQVDDAPACACPTETIDGVTFALCAMPRPWAEAAAFCEARGQTLARLDDKKQAKRLFKVAHKLDDGPWWIGLTDGAVEGTFAWRDGAPVGFTYWKKGQPDDDACHEDCAALKDDAGGRWQDTHCGQPRPFLCR